jgi:opacity protein-like surface antigen
MKALPESRSGNFHPFPTAFGPAGRTSPNLQPTMTIKNRSKIQITGVAGLFLLPTLGAFAQPANSDWSFDLVPYLWVASAEVTTSLPSLPPSTAPGTDRFDTRLAAGAMFEAQVRYRSVGLLMDFAWLRLETEAIQPGPAFSAVELESNLIHATLAATYTLPLEGRFHAELLAGARLWNTREDLEFKGGILPGFQASSERTWADPVIGGALRYDLSRRWSLAAKGLVGGFGVSSDLTWEAFGGVSFRFTDWCSATIGYRYLREDYDRDGFQLDLEAHGALVGVGFHF